MHSSLGVGTEREKNPFVYTRDEVLAHIKLFLQPHYDSGFIPRDHFVLVAKQTLLFVMSAGNLGAQRYSKVFIEQAVNLQLEHLAEMYKPIVKAVKPVSTFRSENPHMGGEVIESHDVWTPCTSPTHQKKTEPQDHRQTQEQKYSSDVTDGTHWVPSQRSMSIIKPQRFQGSLLTRNSSPIEQKGNGNEHRYYYPTPFARHPVPESHTSSSVSSPRPDTRHRTLHSQLQQQKQKQQLQTPLFNEASPSRIHRQITTTTTTTAKRASLISSPLASVRTSMMPAFNTPKMNARHNDDDDEEEEEGPSPIRDRDGDDDNEVRHWRDSEDKPLFALIRQLRSRVPNLHTADHEDSNRTSEVVIHNGLIKSTHASETIEPSEMVPHTSGSGVSEVASIANACLARYAARREILEQWAYERQEILRSEDSDFTALLLMLQHNIIAKLARYVNWEREATTTIAITNRKKATRSRSPPTPLPPPPPPPSTPPPKVQFVTTGESSECEPDEINKISEPEGSQRRTSGTSYLNLLRNTGTLHRESPVLKRNHRPGDLLSPERPRRSASIPTRKNNTEIRTVHAQQAVPLDPVFSAPCTPNAQRSKHITRPVQRLHSPVTTARRTRSAGQNLSARTSTPNERQERAVVVEFLRGLLQPAFNSGVLSADNMADIVQRATRGLNIDMKEQEGGPCVRGLSATWQQKLRNRVERLIGEALVGKY